MVSVLPAETGRGFLAVLEQEVQRKRPQQKKKTGGIRMLPVDIINVSMFFSGKKIGSSLRFRFFFKSLDIAK
jgi:hypothetical protein